MILSDSNNVIGDRLGKNQKFGAEPQASTNLLVINQQKANQENISPQSAEQSVQTQQNVTQPNLNQPSTDTVELSNSKNEPQKRSLKWILGALGAVGVIIAGVVLLRGRGNGKINSAASAARNQVDNASSGAIRTGTEEAQGHGNNSGLQIVRNNDSSTNGQAPIVEQGTQPAQSSGTVTGKPKLEVVTDDSAASASAQAVERTAEEIVQDVAKLLDDAKAALLKGDDAEAVRLLKQAANLGNPKAMIELGNIYSSGVTKNDDLAFDWYKKAFTIGGDDYASKLAQSYHYGRGVTKDYQKAFELYTLGAKAKAKDGASWRGLGELHEKGLGVETNFSKALIYFKYAHKYGEPFIDLSLESLIARKDIPILVKKDAIKLLEEIRKSKKPPVKNVRPKAEIPVATSTPRVKAQPALLPVRASSLLETELTRSNLLLTEGMKAAERKDYDTMARKFKESANLRNPVAMIHLGICNEFGLGYSQNLDKAVNFYNRALNMTSDVNVKETAIRYLKELAVDLEGKNPKLAERIEKILKGSVNISASAPIELPGPATATFKATAAKAVAPESASASKVLPKAETSVATVLPKTATELHTAANDAFAKGNYDDAISLYKQSADAGHPFIVYQDLEELIQRADVPQDVVGKIKVLMKDIKKHNPMIVTIKEISEPLPVQPVVRFTTPSVPIDPKQTEIVVSKANSAFLKGKSDEGIRLYQDAANKGHTGAMLLLGDFYSFGNYVPKDYDVALKWYEKAAQAGASSADLHMQRLAQMKKTSQPFSTMVSKDSVATLPPVKKAPKTSEIFVEANAAISKKDYARAVDLYEKVADISDPYIIYLNLELLVQRPGVPREIVERINKLMVSIRNSENYPIVPVMNNKATIQPNVSASVVEIGGVPKNVIDMLDKARASRFLNENNKLIKFLEERISLGHNGSMIDLGKLYEIKLGGEEGSKLALECYKKAIDAGVPSVEVHLKRLINREGVPLEIVKKAQKLIEDVEKRINRGILLFKEGDAALDKFNYDVAIGKFEEAAKLGNSDAMISLGACLESGYAGTPNMNQAVIWYERAFKNITNPQAKNRAKEILEEILSSFKDENPELATRIEKILKG